MAVTVAEVEEVYGIDATISSGAKQSLLDIATRLASDVFGGRLSRFPEKEGDEDDFIKYLTCHLWEITEGGEISSSSQTGGSVTYNHLTSNIESSLGETRFGRICLMMVRDNASIGIIRADR